MLLLSLFCAASDNNTYMHTDGQLACSVNVSELLHVQVDDEGIDSRRLVEERQKLLNDIERLRAENDSLKVFNMCTCTLHVCVWALWAPGLKE